MQKAVEPIQTPNLKEFRAKVQFYCRLAQKTQRDLAEALGLAYPSLNKKLTGQRSLSVEDVRQIVIALASWQSFESLEQISQLIGLAGYSGVTLDNLFSTEERQHLLIELSAITKNQVNHPHNLPQLNTSFVGRQNELARLWELLPHSRWVTLTGTGGSGKTRLALQASRQLLGHYSGGVWLVEFASLNVEELVYKIVAVTLGIRERTNQSLSQTVIATLKTSGPTLLVLDNCEHLLAPIRHLIIELLTNCLELTVLATSREKLGDQREVVLEVEPLQTPPSPAITTKVNKTGEKPEATALKLVELRRFDSVRLFEERARQSLVSFKLERANAEAVRDICVGLDGIPLALELAASRLSALSVHQLRSRLGERFRLLALDQANFSGSQKETQSALARQQTLRGTVDWSYELLEPAEQILFSRLSIFAGGCTLKEAETVCNADQKLELSLAEGIGSLLQKNLLRQWIGVDGERRYGMLETIRDYGLEKLKERHELATLTQLYADCCLKLIKELIPKLRPGEKRVQGLKVLDSEYQNIQDVLHQSLEVPNSVQTETGIEIAWRLWIFWEMRSYISEAHWWLDLAIEKSQGINLTETLAFANLLNGKALLVKDRSGAKESRILTEQSLEIYRKFNNRPGITRSMTNLASVLKDLGELKLARETFEQVLVMYQEDGNNDGVAAISNNLAILLNQLGDYPQSLKLFQQYLEISRKVGSPDRIVVALNNLAEINQQLGDYEQAEQYLTEAQAINEKLGYRPALAGTLGGLAWLALARQDYAAARSYKEKSLEIYRELGMVKDVMMGLRELGHMETAACHYNAALNFYRQAVELNQQAGNIILEHFQFLTELGQLKARWGFDGNGETQNLIEAVHLYAAAHSLKDKLGFTTTIEIVQDKTNKEIIEQLRQRLGSEEFDQEWQNGLQMEAETALQRALND